MATYQLSPEHTALFDLGGFAEFRLIEDAIEYAERLQPGEPLVVVTCEGSIAFALTPAGDAYDIS